MLNTCTVQNLCLLLNPSICSPTVRLDCFRDSHVIDPPFVGPIIVVPPAGRLSISIFPSSESPAILFYFPLRFSTCVGARCLFMARHDTDVTTSCYDVTFTGITFAELPLSVVFQVA